MIDACNRLVALLMQKKLTLSCAESCTGGLIAKSITDISGCSEVFFGGIVSYDNKVKTGVLGVKESTLEAHGAVSSQTAEEMAYGASRVCFTDIGISTTGIAGPGGGSKEKPVGTVFVGIYINGKLFSKNLCLSPCLSRDEIRESTVRIIIEWTIDKILENY